MYTVVLCVTACYLRIYCCEPYMQITEIVEPEQKATSALIFLHGAGGSGPEMREIVESYIGNFSQFPNTRLIFPTASAVEFPAFPWNGQITNVWYSFNSLVRNHVINTSEMENSAKQLEKLIEQQVASGISHKKICLVGYSSGGMMSINFGYGYAKNLGCIGAISAYIPLNSVLYKKIPIQENNLCVRLPPLYMYSGGLDFIMWPSWITETANKLQHSGISVTYKFQWFGTHFINKDGLEYLFQFIEKSILS
ncbi:lysophospholipase-like protein 1 [Halyomorpha halys]|uniref:lysophospholipase-like protein 1 n=1 Tax=Halyomorpha halys TaxID=286706 RepID=UPI0006D500D5|nr:lysophospholipase-like protein 1 [Halyomorpha halys]